MSKVLVFYSKKVPQEHGTALIKCVVWNNLQTVGSGVIGSSLRKPRMRWFGRQDPNVAVAIKTATATHISIFPSWSDLRQLAEAVCMQLVVQVQVQHVDWDRKPWQRVQCLMGNIPSCIAVKCPPSNWYTMNFPVADLSKHLFAFAVQEFSH